MEKNNITINASDIGGLSSNYFIKLGSEANFSTIHIFKEQDCEIHGCLAAFTVCFTGREWDEVVSFKYTENSVVFINDIYYICNYFRPVLRGVVDVKNIFNE